MENCDDFISSLYDTYNNVLTGASDFKELIPEFYSGSGDFLTHRGVRCNMLVGGGS